MDNNELKYKELVENLNDVVYTTDLNGVVTYISPSVESVAGYKPSEIIGRPFIDFVYEEDLLGRSRRFLSALSGSKEQTEYRYVTKNGETKWILTSACIKTSRDGKVVGIQGILTDITRLKKIQEKLEESRRQYAQLSITDSLTKIYNSRHFYDQLQKEMGRCSRYQHVLSLLMMDIDDFKQYNDEYGHLEGDKVLERLGGVIKDSLRKVDSAYRYGGEEFIAILPEASGEQAEAVAWRIMDNLQKESFSPLPEKTIKITLSIGIAEFMPEEGMKEFVKRADLNMYEAKHRGKNRIYFRRT